LEWKVICGRFKIVAKNLLRSFHNIVLKLKSTTFVANVVPHFVEIKQKVVIKHVNPQISFIDLCDSSDEDGMLVISFNPSKSYLQMNYFPSAFVDSPYFSTKIPFARGPYVLSVVDYFMTMSFAAHANFKLRDLNCDSFCIEIVPYILTTFNGDVLFELPLLINPDGHSN
jgi:hypothetical protein